MKTIKKLLVLAMMFGLMSPITAFAALDETELTDGEIVVGITAVDNVTPVKPVDPNNPTVDRTIVSPGVTAIDIYNPATLHAGPLTIDTAPSFLFKKHQTGVYSNPVSGNGIVTLYSEHTTPYVQISDRRFTGTGWNLKLSVSNLRAYDGSDDLIDEINAVPFVLNLVAPDLETGPDSRIGQKGYTLGNHIATLKPTTLASYTISSDLQSTYGTPLSLMHATTGQGLGTWILRFTGGPTGTNVNFNTDLAVGTAGGQTIYRSVLNWELYDTPAGT